MIRISKLAFMLAALVFAGQASATVITYTSQSSWLAALSGAAVTTETFDGASSSFDENTSDNIIGTNLTLDLGDTGPTGLTGSGQLEFEVDSSSTSSGQGLEINIKSTVFYGFALLNLTDNESSSPTVNLHEIAIIIDGFGFLLSDILGLTSFPETSSEDAIAPFIGFISTVEISSFQFVHGDAIRDVTGSYESFWLDGLSIARSMPNPMPASAPATLAIFGIGLARLGWSRRKKA